VLYLILLMIAYTKLQGSEQFSPNRNSNNLKYQFHLSK